MSTELITREGGEISSFSPMSPQRHLPDDFSIADLRRVILKRYLIIIVSTAVLFAGGLTYSLLKKPRYEASAHIAIMFDESAADGGENSGADSSDKQTRLETQVRVLQSDSLAMVVIRQLHLETNPDFCKPDPKEPSSDSPRRRIELLKAFQSALHVSTMPKTELIEIGFRSRSPQMAVDVVNSLVSAYVERNFKVKYEATMQAADWLQKQLEEIKNTVEDRQARVADFEKQHGVWFTGAGEDNKNSTVSKLDDLDAKLTAAEAERIVKEASWRMAESGNPELVSSSSPDATLQALRTQEGELRNQYAQMSAKYGNSYPKVDELRGQLQEVEGRIRAEVANVAERFRNDYMAARRAEDMLRAKVDEQKKETYKLNEGAVQYTILRHELDSSRELYDSLLKQLKEAGITAGLRSTNVTVVDPATLPVDPVEPNLPRNLALGLASGLVFGLVLAFVVENLDNSLRTIEEVESYSGLTSLGVIPLQKWNGDSRRRTLRSGGAAENSVADVIAVARPQSQIAEAYRSLRTSLLLSSVDTPVKTIVVTSSIPGEGKTSTAINCAAVFAQAGGRILLVDADMRRPSVHSRFGLANRFGLSSVIAGSEPFEKAAVAHPSIPGLTVLPSGPKPPNPAQMLGSRRMAELLAEWRKDFDYVIVDTAPVLAVTDAVLLAAQADTCILVLRWGRTGWQPLRRSRDMLARAQARIAGVVINAVNLNAPDHYYYGAKYTKYYHEEAGN